MLFDADRSPKHFSPKTTGSQSEKSLSPKSQAIQIRQRDIIPPGDFLLKPNNFDLAKSYLNTTPRRKDEPVTDKIGCQIYQSTADSSRIATGKIPGYSGHIPGVIVGGVPGKTFTVLSKLDPKSVRAPPIWMTSYRENSGFGSSAPKSARFYTSATIDKEERAATYREYTAPEQQALTQKYSFGNSAITEELRNQKLITRPLKIPVSRSDSQTKAGDAWVAALSRGRPNERRALSPVGQRPDSESDLWQLCYRYLDGLGVSPDHFDSSLDKSYSATDPPLLTVAGTPYEVPIGWVGFGLRVPPWCDERDIWSHWHTTFLPCPPHCLTTVLHTCTPVMPGDSLIDGSKYKTVHLAQRGFVEAVQPNTRRADRCATRLYTTPSARYAAAKFLSLTRGEGLVVEGRRLCVALQCKQMGGALSLGGYQVCGETIGRADAAPPRSRISPYFDDTRIENYTLRKASVVPYRLLFRLADADSAAAAPTRSSPGPGAVDSEPLVQPYTRDLRWSRVDHPPFGSARSTVPGLELPFFEFDDPASARETTRGGLEPPRPHAPYACFPEHRAVRLPARPHMQPAVAEWTVRPTSGWLDGQPSPGNVLAPVPGAADHGPRTVQGVLDGMRRRIGAVASSFSEVLSRLDGAAAADGGGWISRGELARILTRLGLVVSEEDPLFGEVWRHLAPAGGDGGAALPVRELDRRFGVSAATHDILITLRQRADNAGKMRAAFRVLDPGRTGTVDRVGLRGVLRDCGLGHLSKPATFDLLCSLFAADLESHGDGSDGGGGGNGGADGLTEGGPSRVGGAGRIDYRMMLERVCEDPLVQAGYGSPRGAAKVGEMYETRAPVSPPSLSSSGHGTDGGAELARLLCDEGAALHAQGRVDAAERRYLRALQADPNHVDSLCGLAWLLKNEKNDIFTARGLIERASEIDALHPYVVMQKILY